MKTLLHLLAALLLSNTARAQLIISSIPNVPVGKIDSCAVPTPTGLTAMAVITPATNSSWNLSTIALQTSKVKYTYKAKTAGFSTGSFSDSLGFDFGTATGAGYASWRNVQQISTGTVVLGEEILKRQAKGIGGTTGNSLDSIVFPTQVMAYNNTIPILKVPATMSSKWSATANRNLSFNLTVTSASLTNAPGQHKQVINSLDSVVGWGQMKVPVLGKAASAWIPVLQVRHSDIALDSFFLNGSPASSAILTPLGLSQGQTTTVARTLFYRSGAFRPLIEAVHSGASHSSSLSKVYIHADDLPDDLSVPTGPANDGISLFPNPLSSDRLNIRFAAGHTGHWQFSLFNANDQVLAEGNWVITGGETKALQLGQKLPAGIYFVSLLNEHMQGHVLPLHIN